jgi:hypothetical protein
MTFQQHWPTDNPATYVDFVREGVCGLGAKRMGDAQWLRLTEEWTATAKSVFRFDVQGSVAKSTHAGLPWLKYLRKECSRRIHFWPFDGWQIPDRASVVVEVYLYSIGISGMCCILIMRKCSAQNEYHAVSVTGMKCRRDHLSEEPGSGDDDRSSDLQALCIHDDRIGPYVTAKLEKSIDKKLLLQLEIEGVAVDTNEKWELVQILLPMHGKVRLSFAELWELAVLHLTTRAQSIQTSILKIPRREDIQFDVRVLRAQSYVEELLLAGHNLSADLIHKMSKTVAFSRYVGLVRLTSPSTGSLDVVIDTTSTLKNPIFLIVVPLDGLPAGDELARELAAKLDCDSLLAA